MQFEDHHPPHASASSWCTSARSPSRIPSTGGACTAAKRREPDRSSLPGLWDTVQVVRSRWPACGSVPAAIGGR